MDAAVQPIIIENQQNVTGGPFTTLDSRGPSQYVALKIRLDRKKPADHNDEQ